MKAIFKSRAAVVAAILEQMGEARSVVLNSKPGEIPDLSVAVTGECQLVAGAEKSRLVTLAISKTSEEDFADGDTVIPAGTAYFDPAAVLVVESAEVMYPVAYASGLPAVDLQTVTFDSNVVLSVDDAAQAELVPLVNSFIDGLKSAQLAPAVDASTDQA